MKNKNKQQVSTWVHISLVDRIKYLRFKGISLVRVIELGVQSAEIEVKCREEILGVGK